jgi:uncharacterized protein
LKIRAADLPPEGLTVDETLEMQPLRSDSGEGIPVREAELAGRVVRTSKGLRFTGVLRARVGLVCARCLTPFELGVDRDLELHYACNAPRERDLQIPEDEMDTEFLGDGEELDLTWMAAEQIYLEIPMKPLCAPTCRGLCPCCGADLNSESCRGAGVISRS